MGESTVVGCPLLLIYLLRLNLFLVFLKKNILPSTNFVLIYQSLHFGQTSFFSQKLVTFVVLQLIVYVITAAIEQDLKQEVRKFQFVVRTRSLMFVVCICP